MLIGGGDDDTTQFLYHLNNDDTTAIATGEVTLVATITSDLTNGVADVVVGDFDFTVT